MYSEDEQCPLLPHTSTDYVTRGALPNPTHSRHTALPGSSSHRPPYIHPTTSSFTGALTLKGPTTPEANK